MRARVESGHDTVAASLVGGILLVLALLMIFVGTAYGLSRRGSGVDTHPREDREADQRDEG